MMRTKCDIDALEIKLDCQAMTEIARILLARCKEQMDRTLLQININLPEHSTKLLVMAETVERLSYQIAKTCEVLHALHTCADTERTVTVINRGGEDE